MELSERTSLIFNENNAPSPTWFKQNVSQGMSERLLVRLTKQNSSRKTYSPVYTTTHKENEKHEHFKKIKKFKGRKRSCF